MSKIGRIIRSLIKNDRHWVFNDRLLDGTRSVKVWGWREVDYDIAAKALEAAGCTVKKVRFGGYSIRGGCNYQQTRLHVKENG